MPQTYAIKFDSQEIEIYKPLLKWVGGKQKLMSDILETFPKEMDNYYEPFMGGGSVLLGILSLQKNNKIIIRNKIYAYDINKYLISFYQNIQKHPVELSQQIQKLKVEMNTIKKLKEDNRKEIRKTINKISENDKNKSKELFYYWTRKVYNDMSEEEKCSIKGSAYLLFLNKTCFRGLYRIGKKKVDGVIKYIFNVPFGNYNNPEISTLENINEISDLIQNVIFQCASFEETLLNTKNGDFLYLDPPYSPENDKSFVSYTKEGFDLENHKKLFQMLNQTNCAFVLSNSKVDLVTNSFKDENKFKIDIISCRRAINSKNPESTTDEVIITNQL